MHKKLRPIHALLFGLLLAPLAVPAVISPAQASTSTSGVLKGYRGLKCLDEDTDKPGRLQLWSCTGTSQQRWTRTIGSAFTSDTGQFVNVDMLQNSRTGKCVTAPDPNALQQFVVDQTCETFPTSPWQTWEEIFSVIDSGGHRYTTLRNQATHLCLYHEIANPDGTDFNGTPIFQTACDAPFIGPHLYWYLP